MPTIDIKSRFPLFKNHPNLVYLDNAATTQRVDSALKEENDYYLNFNANVHRGLYPISEQATDRYEAVRDKVAKFLNAKDRRSIIFTQGSTDSLNRVAQGWGCQFLKKGDEVVLSQMEHHSNLVPWQITAEKTGAVLRFCPITAKGNLDYKALEKLMNPRTKMVSITGLSNTLGALVDLKKVRAISGKVGALLCVDAAQLAAHQKIDLQKIDPDFLVFSAHKLYGPTGVGVLYGKTEILNSMVPWMGGGSMIKEVFEQESTWNEIPWKFEAGTPAIAQVIGMGGALDFMMETGLEKIEKLESELMDFALKSLAELPFVTVYGPKNSTEQCGVISLNVEGVHPHDVAAILGESEICVRAGHHCTMPLMKKMDVVSTVRVSLAVYNNKIDIEVLIKGLKKVVEVFKIK